MHNACFATEGLLPHRDHSENTFSGRQASSLLRCPSRCFFLYRANPPECMNKTTGIFPPAAEPRQAGRPAVTNGRTAGALRSESALLIRPLDRRVCLDAGSHPSGKILSEAFAARQKNIFPRVRKRHPIRQGALTRITFPPRPRAGIHLVRCPCPKYFLWASTGSITPGKVSFLARITFPCTFAGRGTSDELLSSGNSNLPILAGMCGYQPAIQARVVHYERAKILRAILIFLGLPYRWILPFPFRPTNVHGNGRKCINCAPKSLHEMSNDWQSQESVNQPKSTVHSTGIHPAATDGNLAATVSIRPQQAATWPQPTVSSRDRRQPVDNRQ